MPMINGTSFLLGVITASQSQVEIRKLPEDFILECSQARPFHNLSEKSRHWVYEAMKRFFKLRFYPVIPANG